MVVEKLETEDIYEIMKDRIIHLKYEPSQVLNEVDVASEFEISRTPIRRVFQMLQNDKLINIIPRYGAQVAPVDFREMKSIFEITRELDPFAAKLATERITLEQIEELEAIMLRMNSYDIKYNYQEAIDDDERFHSIIYSSCGNPWLSDILTSLHYHTERLWHYVEQHFDSMDLFTGSLGQLLNAVKKKDHDKAELYARQHVDEFVSKIKKELF